MLIYLLLLVAGAILATALISLLQEAASFASRAIRKLAIGVAGASAFAAAFVGSSLIIGNNRAPMLSLGVPTVAGLIALTAVGFWLHQRNRPALSSSDLAHHFDTDFNSQAQQSRKPSYLALPPSGWLRKTAPPPETILSALEEYLLAVMPERRTGIASISATVRKGLRLDAGDYGALLTWQSRTARLLSEANAELPEVSSTSTALFRTLAKCEDYRSSLESLAIKLEAILSQEELQQQDQTNLVHRLARYELD